MDNGVELPESVWAELTRFDLFANQLKLEYLEACCTRKFNPSVIQELTRYYGKPVTLLGGMNEAFRMFLFQRDVEQVCPSSRSGQPFECSYPQRAGEGGLFLDYDPREGEAVREINRACACLKDLVCSAHSLVQKVAIATEYLALKVTAHDLFIHGQGDFPAAELRASEAVTRYIEEVAEAKPDAFRAKHALALALTKGIDPAECIAERCCCQERGLIALCKAVRALSQVLNNIQWEDFFRWDVYGMCAFIEGPVAVRRDRRARVAQRLREEWNLYEWRAPRTATEASRFITERLFLVLLDHRAVFDGGRPSHLQDARNREKYLTAIHAAQDALWQLRASAGL